MSDKSALIEKIRTLIIRADRCSGPEKEAAENMIEHLMTTYGITSADIDDSTTNLEIFKYKDELHKKLLLQVIYMVMGDVGIYSRRGNSKQIAVNCTATERIEIEIALEFYKQAMQKELDIFFKAFCHKNSLFPPEDTNKNTEESELSKEDMAKLIFMSTGMDKHILNKMLQS